MAEQTSMRPSNYTPPQTPEVGVNAYVDKGTDWGSLIEVVGKGYSQFKTEQFREEQTNLTEGLKYEMATDQRVKDISTARNIMEKQATGAITEADTKELQRIQTTYGNLAAAVEQGRQTQRGFEMRAQALLRESIKRRPDLTKELNEMYSAAVGTPSLDMLQHRYFAEDLNWVGQATKQKEGATVSQITSQLNILKSAAELAETAEDKAALLATYTNASSLLFNQDLAGAQQALADPAATAILQRGLGGGTQAFEQAILFSRTNNIPEKLAGFNVNARQLALDSPGWNSMMGEINKHIVGLQQENEALTRINTPMALQKIEQNKSYIARMEGITSRVDSPEKALAFNTAYDTNLMRELTDPTIKGAVADALADYPAEQVAPLAAMAEMGSMARKTGYIDKDSYMLRQPSPKSFQLLAGQFARNPKGDRLKDSEKLGYSLLMSSTLAAWGLPVKDAQGRVIARSMQDYFDPSQGVLASLATMLPAMNNVYMNRQVAVDNPTAFKRNVGFLAGVLDQANLSVARQLEAEGLGQFVKRGSFLQTMARGVVPDFNTGIQIVGKPDAAQRKRIEELTLATNSMIVPVGSALRSYFKTGQEVFGGQ